MDTWIGSRDVDFQSLLRMDYLSIRMMSFTNKLFLDICSDPYFWKEKMRYDRLSHLIPYKPKHISQALQYISLVDNKPWTYHELVDENRFDIFLYKYRHYTVPENVDHSAVYGRISFLYLFAQEKILPSPEACFIGTAHGHLEVTIWAEQNGIQIDTIGNRISCSGKENIVNIAAEEGYIDVVKYFHKNYNIPLQIKGATRAAVNGHLDIVMWFKEHGIGISPYIDVTNLIVNDNREMMEYLEVNGIKFTSQCADIAAVNGNISMLFWFESRGIFPNYEQTVYRVALDGHIEILKLYIQRNVYPGNDVLYPLLEKKDLDTLDFLASIQIVPTQQMISSSMGFGHDIRTLEWLIGHGFSLDQKYANVTAAKGDLESLNLLANYGIYPNRNAIIAILKKGHIDVMEWLHARGRLPDTIILPEIEKLGSKVLSWLLEYGYRPLHDGVIDHDNILCSRHLDFLLSNGIIPTIQQAMTKENMDLIIRSGIYTPKQIMFEAMMTQNIKALNWLTDKYIKPDQELVSFAIRTGLISVVEWLTDCNFI